MNKLYLIIIGKISNIDIDKVRESLGLENLRPGKLRDMFSAQLILEGYCIGKYKDNVLIVSPVAVFEFFNVEIGPFAKRVSDVFADKEIVVLTLYSVIDSYGFAVVSNGERLRAKWGGEGDKIYIDYGDKIKEENEVNEEAFVDGSHLGTNIVHMLLRRYFGKDDKEVESNLCKINLLEYK